MSCNLEARTKKPKRLTAKNAETALNPVMRIADKERFIVNYLEVLFYWKTPKIKIDYCEANRTFVLKLTAGLEG